MGSIGTNDHGDAPKQDKRRNHSTLGDDPWTVHPIQVWVGVEKGEVLSWSFMEP